MVLTLLLFLPSMVKVQPFYFVPKKSMWTLKEVMFFSACTCQCSSFLLEKYTLTLKMTGRPCVRWLGSAALHQSRMIVLAGTFKMSHF